MTAVGRSGARPRGCQIAGAPGTHTAPLDAGGPTPGDAGGRTPNNAGGRPPEATFRYRFVRQDECMERRDVCNRLHEREDMHITDDVMEATRKLEDFIKQINDKFNNFYALLFTLLGGIIAALLKLFIGR